MKQSSFKYYIPLVLLTAAMLLGIAAGFNAMIDPYAMNVQINIPGINLNKPCIDTRLRLFKTYEIERVKPDSILIGSSRCLFAFRTSHPGWMKESQKRYNLAFDSATTKEMYFYLVHAYAVHPLKLVLLGLDSYHPYRPVKTEPDFDEGILMDTPGFLSRLKIILADMRILTSIDTLKNSIFTIRSQKNALVPWYTPDGQKLGELFFHRSDGDLQKFGQRFYFDKYDKTDVQYYINKKIPAFNESRIYADAPIKNNDNSSSLDYISKMIRFCRDHGIKLIIFFTPEHAHHLELSAAGIGLEQLENGKRKLVQLLARDARQNPGEIPIPLFDFSNYSRITTEPLPPTGSHMEMRYYWDSSHFKENVGDLVLNRIFGIADPKNSIPADFGVLLTEKNIEDQIVQMNKKHDLYKTQHPKEIEQIEKWTADYKKIGTNN